LCEGWRDGRDASSGYDSTDGSDVRGDSGYLGGIVIVRAALCPSPPLLASELTGRALVLPELRDACAAAVARLVGGPSDLGGPPDLGGSPDLGGPPDLVAVVGAGAATATWDPDDRLDLSAYAPAAGTPADTSAAGAHVKPGLPLALGLGALLLDRAGYTGPRLLQAVDESEPAGACLRLGREIAGVAARVAVLAVGDGSARRAPSAPGYLDERAAPFDDAVRHAVRNGDMAALAGLDPPLARDLMATGRAAWQVLVGAVGTSTRPRAEIHYADAPFGVAYLVAAIYP
jgi:hypothetical protein